MKHSAVLHAQPHLSIMYYLCSRRIWWTIRGRLLLAHVHARLGPIRPRGPLARGSPRRFRAPSRRLSRWCCSAPQRRPSSDPPLFPPIPDELERIEQHDNPESPQEEEAAIPVIEAGPDAFYVWSAAAAERLRTQHRIMGEWVGCASNHASQNQFLSLPLALSRYEVAAGVLAGFLQLHPRPADAYAAVDDAHVQVFMAEREAAAAEQRQQEERQTEMRRLRFMAEEEMRLRRRRRREGARADAGQEVGVDGGGGAPKRQRVGNADGQAQWLPRWWWRWRWTVGWLPALGRPLAGIAHVWTAILRPWTFGKHGTNATSPMPPDATESSTASQCTRSSSSRQAAERSPRPYHVRVRRERAPYEPLDARRAKVLRATELRRSPAWQSTLRSSQFVVFRDLWRRGFYLTNGNKFGADFLAYAHDPCLFHAGLCIIVLEARTVLHPRDMISLGRLGVATKKRAVLAHVSDAQRERVAYHGIAWCEQLP